MRYTTQLGINLKKLRFHPMKAALLILPITILVGVAVFVSIETKNVSQAAQSNVFDELAKQYNLLRITPAQEQVTAGPRTGGGFVRGAFNLSSYTEDDAAKIAAVPHVESAAVNYTVPLQSAAIQNVVDDTDINLGSVQVLTPEAAAYYTKDTFTYTAGQPVPIILNSSSFVASKENWNGQTEITVDLRAQRNQPPSPDELQNQFPVSTQAIDYNEDDIVGKTFTLNIGGLGAVPTYATQDDSGTITFKQLSADEQTQYSTSRDAALGQYWNVDTLKQPLEYQVVVVGIINDETDRAAYVPENFAREAMAALIQKQLDARTSTELTADILDEGTITGLTYNGSELTSGGAMGGGRGFSASGPGGGGFAVAFGADSNDSYAIPGLVIETDSSGTTQGVLNNANVLDDAVQKGDAILAVVDNVNNRAGVIAAINAGGYAMQDVNNLTVFDTLQRTTQTISTSVMVGFILLTAIVVMISLFRYVTESKREIGIFRAFGYTQAKIITQFISQAVLYTLVGYVGGIVLGVIGVFAGASVVHQLFSSFVKQTVAKTVYVVGDVGTGVFMQIQLLPIITAGALLLIITVLAALLPALRAAKMNPVEAIKSE